MIVLIHTSLLLKDASRLCYIRVSNAAANRQATPEEVRELQLAFGGDVNALSLFEYRCVCFERLFCAVLCFSADICLHLAGLREVWLRCVVACVDIGVALLVVYLAMFFPGSLCSRCTHTFNQLFRPILHSQQELQRAVLFCQKLSSPPSCQSQ